MTWGVTNPGHEGREKKVHTVTQSVPVVGDYSSYPTKEVFHTTLLLLIAGVFAACLGIGHLIITWRLIESYDAAKFANGYTIVAGIFFIIAGAMGLDSCRRRSRGRIIASTVLASLAIFVAFCVGIHTLRSLFLYQSYDNVPPYLPEDDYDPEPDPDYMGRWKLHYRTIWTLKFREDVNMTWNPLDPGRSMDDARRRGWFREDSNTTWHKGWWRENTNSTWLRGWFRVLSSNHYFQRFFRPHHQHRQKRFSFIIEQFYENEAYFATTLALMVVFVTAVAAALNVVILAVSTLKKGRNRNPDVMNGNAVAAAFPDGAIETVKKYFHTSIVTVVLGVLFLLCGIAQVWVAHDKLESNLGAEFLFLLTGYPVWLSVAFILTGVYALRSCQDANLMTRVDLVRPVVCSLIAGMVFGYSIRTLFYPHWNLYAGTWGLMYDDRMYLLMIISVCIVTLAILVCFVLQIYFTVVIRRFSVKNEDGVTDMRSATRKRMEAYRLDPYKGDSLYT